MLKEPHNRIMPLLLAFFACFFTLFAHAQEEGKELFGKGFNMMMDQRYGEAIPIWEELLEERPDSPHLNYLLGACLHRSSDRKLEGIPHFEKALEETVPQSKYRPRYDQNAAPIDAHYYLADLYHLDYRFGKAIQHYKLFRQQASESVVEQVPVPVERKISMCKSGKELKVDPVQVKVRNLGPKVNSSYKEHSPAINLDETTLYFTSRRLRPDSSNADMIDPETGEYYEDIYVSYKENGQWQEPRLLDLNSPDHEATINLSKDARTLFIYKDERGSGNIYESERLGDSLSEPRKLGDHVNSDAYETHIDISADNDVLYFSSDREGGQGGKDLYRVKRLPTGEWAKPQNLGPTINTPYDEDGPFIHPDGKTLYFSSEGHNTMGGYDVFRTRMNPSGTWAEPQNIGHPVNSPDDDIYFVTTPDGKRAYYSSDFKGLKTEMTGEIKGYGNSDIYMLEFPEFEEKRLTLLKGLLRPGNCKDLLADIRIMVERVDDGSLVQQLQPRTRDGRFVAILPPGERYTVRYLRGGRLFHEERIEVKAESAYQEIQRALHLDTLDFDCSRGRLALVDPDKGELEEGDDRIVRVEEKEAASEGEKGEAPSGEGRERGAETARGSKERTGSGKKAKEEEEASRKVDEEPRGSVRGEDGIREDEVEGFEPYMEHFDYNESVLTTEGKAFSSFVERLAERARTSDRQLSIRVQASASRVPTGRYKDNRSLARLRAENAVEMLEKALQERGLGAEEFSIDQVEQLVQGPYYDGNAQGEKEKYLGHQYVRIALLR